MLISAQDGHGTPKYLKDNHNIANLYELQRDQKAQRLYRAQTKWNNPKLHRPAAISQPLLFKLLQPPFCYPNSSRAISSRGLRRVVGLGEAGCQPRALTRPLEALAETRRLGWEGADPFLEHQVRSAEDTCPPRFRPRACTSKDGDPK